MAARSNEVTLGEGSDVDRSEDVGDDHGPSAGMVAEVADCGAALEQAANAARTRAAPRLPTIRCWNEFGLAITVVTSKGASNQLEARFQPQASAATSSML